MANKQYKKIPLRPASRSLKKPKEETAPPTFEVGLHPYAHRDRRNKLRYIAGQSEQNAALVRQRLSTALRSLGTYPYIGRRGRAAGTRELIVPKTRLIIAYVVLPHLGVVVAIRIMHSSQMWPTGQLERLATAKKLSIVGFVTRTDEPETV